jgi:hypothetical protein
LARHAVALELLNVGVRVRFDDKTVLGEKQPEVFREYDVFANFQLPWQHRYASGWGWSLRLLASAGIMQGMEETGSSLPVSRCWSSVARMGGSRPMWVLGSLC